MLLFHFAVRAGIMFVLLTIGLTGSIVALVKTFDSLADPSRSAPPPLVLAPHCFMNPKLVEERTSLQSAQGAYNAKAPLRAAGLAGMQTAANYNPYATKAPASALAA